MLKKKLGSGVMYLVIAVLFVAGAVSKSVSDDAIVLAMLWFCALVFFVVGVLRLKKSIS